MPVDVKYGQVTMEHGDHIPADEPVFVFRAKDGTLPQVLRIYHTLCLAAGSPQRHLDWIMEAVQRVERWQRLHEVKVPDSETSRAWME